MDRGAWWATVNRVTKSWTWLKRLNTHKCIRFPPRTWQIGDSFICILVGDDGISFWRNWAREVLDVRTPDLQEGVMRYLVGISEMKWKTTQWALSFPSFSLLPAWESPQPAHTHPTGNWRILLWRMQTTHREGPQTVTFGDPQWKPSVGIRLPGSGAKQSVSLVSAIVSYCLMQKHTKDDQIFEDRLWHERKKAKQIMQVEKWTQRKLDTATENNFKERMLFSYP